MDIDRLKEVWCAKTRGQVIIINIQSMILEIIQIIVHNIHDNLVVFGISDFM